MNPKDREDILLIVETVLDQYLSEKMVKEAVAEVDQSIRDNWNILKLIRERKQI